MYSLLVLTYVYTYETTTGIKKLNLSITLWEGFDRYSNEILLAWPGDDKCSVLHKELAHPKKVKSTFIEKYWDQSLC